MRQTWSQDELALLKKNLDSPIEDVCKLFPDRSFNSVHVQWKRMRKVNKISKVLEDDYNAITKKEKTLSLEKRYKESLKEIAKLKDFIEVKNKTLNHHGTYVYKSNNKFNKPHVVAVAPFSDVHAGKVVTLEETFGLNEYNIDICEKRLNCYFNSLVKLITQHGQNTIVDKLIFAPIGDLIDGYIHEEQRMQNELSSIEATIWMKDRLIAGVEFLLSKLDVPLIEIPFVTGNHSRNTDKMYFSKVTETSYETIIADALIKHFEHNERVKIHFNKSNIVFIENVFGKTLRFEHGHSIKFGGGIGGVTVPIIKAIAKDQVAKKYDCLIIGHFHQQFDGGRFIINGSIIGYDKYAIDHHFEYEEPKQAFFLIDDEGRRIQMTQVFLN